MVANSGPFRGQRDRLERGRDRAVIRRCVRERRAGEVEPERQRRSRRLVERREHARVVVGRDDHEHVAEILGSRAHHARAADIDFFDQVVERRVGVGSRSLERVEVHGHHVDEADAVRSGGREVLGVVASREDAAVHQRVQRLRRGPPSSPESR